MQRDARGEPDVGVVVREHERIIEDHAEVRARRRNDAQRVDLIEGGPVEQLELHRACGVGDRLIRGREHRECCVGERGRGRRAHADRRPDDRADLAVAVDAADRDRHRHGAPDVGGLHEVDGRRFHRDRPGVQDRREHRIVGLGDDIDRSDQPGGQLERVLAARVGVRDRRDLRRRLVHGPVTLRGDPVVRQLGADRALHAAGDRHERIAAELDCQEVGVAGHRLLELDGWHELRWRRLHGWRFIAAPIRQHDDGVGQVAVERWRQLDTERRVCRPRRRGEHGLEARPADEPRRPADRDRRVEGSRRCRCRRKTPRPAR